MRNMIKVNEIAFGKLIDQFVQSNAQTVEDGKRYVKTTDSEKEWLKQSSNFDIVHITPNIRIVQFEFGKRIYFALIGGQIDADRIESTALEDVELNAGIITLLVSLDYLKLDKKANLLEFYDLILFQHQNKEYLGHEYLDLIPFLEKTHLFALPEHSMIKSSIINRVACCLFAKNPSQLILDFDNTINELIFELSLAGSDNISYKILLSCLFSTSYKHAFLELYRLIERLFPVSYLKEFHLKTDTKLTFLDFVSQLENITGWRPIEKEAIEKIFTNAKSSTIGYFQNFHNSLTVPNSHNNSNFFYNLRNSIVHFRANHSEWNLTKDQWNMLLIATLYLIDDQYSIYNDILNENT